MDATLLQGIEAVLELAGAFAFDPADGGIRDQGRPVAGEEYGDGLALLERGGRDGEPERGLGRIVRTGVDVDEKVRSHAGADAQGKNGGDGDDLAKAHWELP
jgi:hypothetical protein